MKFNFENAKDKIKKWILATGSIIATAVPARSQEIENPASTGNDKMTSSQQEMTADTSAIQPDTETLDESVFESPQDTFAFEELEKIYLEHGGAGNMIMMGSVDIAGWGTTYYDVQGESIKTKYRDAQGLKIKEEFDTFADLEKAHPTEYQAIMVDYQAQYEATATNAAFRFLTDELTEKLPKNYEDFQPDETLASYIEDLARRRANGENLDGYDDIISYIIDDQGNGREESEYRATKKYGYNVYELASYLQQNQFDAFVKKFEGEKGE